MHLPHAPHAAAQAALGTAAAVSLPSPPPAASAHPALRSAGALCARVRGYA